jgi:subtilisin family serine protease
MRRHSFRLLISLLLIGLLLSFPLPLGAAHMLEDSSAEYVPNEVIVKLIPAINLSSLLALLPLKLQVIDQLDSLPILRLRILNGASPLDVASRLIASRLVIYAEPNYLGGAPEGVARSSWARSEGPEAYQEQWAPAAIRLPEALSISRGAGSTVAVLDTGADLDHPALAGHLTQGIDFVDGDLDPSEAGAYGQDIAFGHGTHVAGIIAMTAPEAKIMPVRILRPDGTGQSWLLAQAIRYVTEQKVQVINISYSVHQRSLLIDDLLSRVTALLPGALVVAAAGNSGPSTAPEYPAADDAPGLVAVAASTQNDQLASFSTRGSWVDLAAPGESITSSVPDDLYGTWSGTSMAAPLVAGTAALVQSANPGLSAEQVAQRIVVTAARISSPVAHRVDAAAAVGLLTAR